MLDCDRDAEEAVQEALLRAWRSRAKQREPGSELGWVLRITQNEALRCRARLQRRPELAVDTVELPELETTEEELATRLWALDVRAALDELEAEDVLLLRLRYERDLTQPRVAELAGLPEGTVKVRLHRLRGRLRERLRGNMSQTKTGVDPRLVKAIAHPLRLKLLTLLNERVASPSELAEELGETIGNVSYHVRRLAELECIELVRTTPVRGALEHHYRAVARPMFTDDDWASLPQSIRKSLADAVLSEIAVEMAGAAEEGGFNRDEMHVSRTPIVLDRQGWAEINELLQGVVFQALEIQAQSADRLQEAGADQSEAAALVLMLFEPPTCAGKSGRRKSARRKKK